MSILMWMEHFGSESLSELEHRAHAEQGLEDGLKGAPARSHARAYTSAYEQGVLFRCAGERRIAIAYGNACRCPRCLEIYPGVIGGTCGCLPAGVRLEVGAEVIYGPGEPDDDCLFYDAEDLKRLCREGVQIQTTNGERLNEQILVQ